MNTLLSQVEPSVEELRLIESLRRGEETAFVSLIDRYHALGRLTEDSIPEKTKEELLQVFRNWKKPSP